MFRIKDVRSGVRLVAVTVAVAMVNPREYFDRSYPDHDHCEPHHGPRHQEVQSEAELPAAAPLLVLGVKLLPRQISSPAQFGDPARERVDIPPVRVCPAHVDGEEGVGHHVEGDVGHHHPGHHPLQLGGFKLDSEKYGEEGDDLGAVTNKPVAPVENPPIRMAG